MVQAIIMQVDFALTNVPEPRLVCAVPFIPLISIFCNIHLMMRLDTMTWIRFAIWMFLGFFIYFTYGIRKSVMRYPPSAKMLDSAVEDQPVPPVVIKTEQSHLIH
ncbi:SLC7A1 [Cordylochernes scorpioides]|uniref:SLC7A1 n=1 Tax=Cordylochernes scorpioides TaxID=51811 RepID=A0ABY6LM99_9ARAC|nr:SLC7A1 [Cordylochernes scorpioides]